MHAARAETDQLTVRARRFATASRTGRDPGSLADEPEGRGLVDAELAVAALDLEDGLAKMASGKLAPEVLRLRLIRLRESARYLSLDALRIRARRGGNYLSHFKGRGMEVDESRPYQPGDDPRNIDWRVTARRADFMLGFQPG